MQKTAYPSSALRPMSTGVAGQAADIPQTGLEAILGQAQAILSFVQHQTDRIEKLNGKLHGTPYGDAKESQKPMSAGLIAQIDDVLNDISARLQSTDETISSIIRAV